MARKRTTASKHIRNLALFYLIGLAYGNGARSFREIAGKLSQELSDDLAKKVAEDVPKSVRAVHQTIQDLEDFSGQQLVNRRGDGLGYDGLTQAGEAFWHSTAAFVAQFWGGDRPEAL